MPRRSAGPWVVVLVAVALAGCRARDPALERAAIVSAGSLTLGEPCATATECASGFCVDGVCCNTACGGGVRDLLSCSNLYGTVSGLTNGTCTALHPGDPCGALSSVNPCTWRGSIVNGGGNCPNPPGTTGFACYPCSDSTACTAAFPVCVNGACVECADSSTCGAGQTCNATLGNCGSSCTTDADCASATQWCAGGACTLKLPDGSALPAIAPIGGICTPETGARVCLSGMCDPTKNACGCSSDGACGASDSGMVCDTVEMTCKPGCRGVGGNVCGPGATCTSRDGAVGACVTVEGGGPSCSTAPTGGAAWSWWITLALLGATLRRVRRWGR